LSIRWITPELGTAPADEVFGRDDVLVVDVRNLLDKEGNDLIEVSKRIEQGLASLRRGQRTVVACDYGMSRSNAIAAGIISKFQGIPFISAVRLVVEATGEGEIKATVLSAVRAAISSPNTTNIEAPLRTVLVTGASGTTGSTVRKSLERYFKVLSPTRRQLDLEKGTTLLELYIEENQVTHLVHLANPRVSASNLGFGRSLTMLRNVLDVCVQRNISLLYPSSAEVYSGYSGTLEADETTPLFARGPLGEAKYVAETMIANCEKMTSLRCCVVRSPPIYGPHLPKPKFLNSFIGKAIANQPILTHRYGSEEPRLDLLFVDDFAEAISCAVASSYVGPLNIGTGTLTSTRVIAELVCELTESQSNLAYSATSAKPNSVSMNAAKAKQAINWTARTSLREGLIKTIDGFGKGKIDE